MREIDQFSNLLAVVSARRRAARNLVPPPDMLPSAWAEQNIVIPVGNAKPGPIRFDNAPHQRGMIDVVKEPGVRRVSYMMAAQTGKTTVQQCIMSYFIKHEPQSQIFVQPTQGDVQTFLETKLRPMLEANSAIAAVMAKQRGREGVNNSRIISFIGGWLMFAWAGSPKTLRGRSAPKTHADEIDGMDATPEGDPGELLAQRAATFGDDALRTESSTPTIKGESRIETAFLEGDQRRYYVACPHCDHPQHLKWGNVTWQGRHSHGIDDYELDLGQDHLPETAGYICDSCGVVWNDGERIAAIRNAEKQGHGWKATKMFRGHASFHGPEFLSTFRKMQSIVQSYLDKIALDDIQSFVNVSLGETYEERGEKADPEGLMARREEYRAQAPAGALYLTCGIDMQNDRLELEIVGWGLGEESWSIGYRVLWGDTLQQDVWDDLDDVLGETFMHESGAVMSISAACLDTGGNAGHTQRAYDYARGRTGRRLFAIKGQGGWGIPVVQAPQRKRSGKSARKVDLFIVGADEAKLMVMRRLAKTEPGPGYCHFPADDAHTAEYFKQLTAERLVTRYVKGQPVREWDKPDRARNEALDCRVYALAALKIMNPSFKRLEERFAARPSVRQAEDIPVRMKEAPENVQRALQAIQAAKRKPAEIPQEEPPDPANDNGTVKKARRTLKRSKGSWATKW